MVACQSFQHNFDKPLQDNPSLLESLTRNHVKPAAKPLEESSITGILGKLKLWENSVSSPTSSFPVYLSSSTDNGKNSESLSSNYKSYSNKNGNFLSMNSERLQLCTEGLGSESFAEMNDDWHDQNNSISITEPMPKEHHRSSDVSKSFPPPITSIRRNGKPSVCFKTCREGGRFVLKEIRMPSQEFLHACREDGRLKLQYYHPDDETQDEEENEDECGVDTDETEYTDDSEDQYDGSTSYEKVHEEKYANKTETMSWTASKF